jgi:predicted nucleotidyltransferase component of viral defense system
MMASTKDIKNVAHSVSVRLKSQAKEQGFDYQFLLERYAVERLLYRLSQSDYREKFVLKGGSLFLAWQGKSHRVTRDLDLLGLGTFTIAEMETVFKNIIILPIEIDDGIAFLSESIKGEEIKEDANYPGIRVTLTAKIVAANLKVQVDIGFGDAITPQIELVNYPTLVEMPAPKLQAYPTYTVIAEKFEAMIQLGIRNSRMKDFYDLWFMSRSFSFDGAILQQALKNTFTRRKTDFPTGLPFPLSPAFYSDSDKEAQWKAFANKKTDKIETFDEVLTLPSVIQEISHFLMPVVGASQQNQLFILLWDQQQRQWLASGS